MNNLTVVTPPAYEPISLQQTKDFLKVDHNDDDALISELIVAAREWGEWFTQRAFITQTLDATLDCFPTSTWPFPRKPVQSVTSVTYLDTSGVPTVWASSNYVVDTAGSRLAVAYGILPPSYRNTINAVTIRFVAGYGTMGDVPEGIKYGLLDYIAGRYDKRGGLLTSDEYKSITDKLWPERVVKF